MTTYIIRRLAQLIVVLAIVTVLVFLMVRLLPGDPILMFLTQEDMEEITQEQVDELRHQLGMDRSLMIQYFSWVSGVVQGDLGTSIIHRGKVMDDIKNRLPITLYIGGLAFAISIIIGIPLGIVAAVKRGNYVDNAITGIANIGVTTPSFWLGILMIYILGYKLGWLPIYGYTSPFEDPVLNAKQMIMPVFCLAIAPIASAARLTRSCMLEVLHEDYIRTAWSKGLTERIVILRHALKNSIIPVVTLKGMSLAGIVGGSVFIETVFSIPGMGRLAVEGLFSQDYPVVQGCILIVGTVILLANLLIDISYAWLDPRIRYK